MRLFAIAGRTFSSKSLEGRCCFRDDWKLYRDRLVYSWEGHLRDVYRHLPRLLELNRLFLNRASVLCFLDMPPEDEHKEKTIDIELPVDGQQSSHMVVRTAEQ